MYNNKSVILEKSERTEETKFYIIVSFNLCYRVTAYITEQEA